MSSKEQKRASRRDKKNLTTRIAFSILTIVTLFLLTCVVVLSVDRSRGDITVCDSGYPVNPRNSEKPGVFDSLTVKEYNSVIDYLFKKTNLSLVQFNVAFPNSSYIFLIDLLLPLKEVALEHLDYGVRQPQRAAHVIIVRGDLRTPRVEEYHVGPIPNPSYHIKVTNPSYTKSNIPYNSKPVDGVEYKFLIKILKDTAELLYPLLMESYGLSYHNCTGDNDCILFHDVSPRGIDETERKSWFGAYREVEGAYLHPLGLEIQIDHSSTDIQNWHIDRIVYNGNFAYSPENLLQLYLNGGINKADRRLVEDKETSFSSLWQRDDHEMEEPLKGPTLIEPMGHRYRVDGFHVSYMKWNMNIRMRTSTGLQIFDIRFNDERIIYELSFQELAIFYSGYGPVSDQINTFGSSFIMGAKTTELIPGVDCPETSTFLDSDHFYNNHKPHRTKNSICIFEDHAHIPIRRHFSTDKEGEFQYYGGLGNYRLTIRTISTLWNYDFIFDYIFYLNGAIETKVSSSGYLQSAFPLHHELRLGSPVHSSFVANIYQQFFNFKIDVDINGRENRFGTIDFDIENITRQWYHNSQKQQLVYKHVWKRDEYKANYGSKLGNDYDMIFNQFTPSKFGSPRAYRIVNNNQINFLLSGGNIARGASWAKFPLAISKFQEWESSSSSIYNGNRPWDPIIDFERFLKNNDSFYDEDLVAWVTMGNNKVPHTEDVPTMTTAGSQVSFYLLPFNFFTHCPTLSSRSSIHIAKDRHTRELFINTFGTPLTSSCVQKENKPSNFDGK